MELIRAASLHIVIGSIAFIKIDNQILILIQLRRMKQEILSPGQREGRIIIFPVMHTNTVSLSMLIYVLKRRATMLQ